MAKKERPLCPVCQKRRAAFPKANPTYCADDWQIKLGRRLAAGLDFQLTRLFRTGSAEVYIVLHRANPEPVGRVVVLTRRGETLVISWLEEGFDWKGTAYELEGDPQIESRSEALLPAIMNYVVDSWSPPDEEPAAGVWTFIGRLVKSETGELAEGRWG